MPSTIQLKEKTISRLKYFKKYSKESYDEVINHLLDEREESQLSDKTIKDIQESFVSMKEGKGTAIEDVAAELGIEL